MKISKKAGIVPASMTLEITAKVKQMKKEGKSIIGFTAGEPDFDTPSYIIESAKKALDIGFTKYTPASGMPELKKAVCKKFKEDNGLDYTPDQIIISSGAKASLFHAVYSMIDCGDEVIIPAPFWFTYEEQVKLAGGKPVVIMTKAENGYKMTADELENAITDKTVCVMLNSPCNPTGAVYTVKELEALATVVEKHNLAVISDEIYEKLIYDGQKHVSIASLNNYMKENTVVINGVSKSYSMTGWRIGYLAAPKSLANVIGRVQSHTTSNPCSISQYASVEALSKGSDIIENMRLSFDERRKYMMKRMDEIDGIKYIVPQGAFYMFMDISAFIGKTIDGKEIKGSLDFANILVDYGVAVIPGLPFYADNYVRLSYAVSLNDIKDGFDRIENFVKLLK